MVSEGPSEPFTKKDTQKIKREAFLSASRVTPFSSISPFSIVLFSNGAPPRLSAHGNAESRRGGFSRGRGFAKNLFSFYIKLAFQIDQKTDFGAPLPLERRSFGYFSSLLKESNV